MMSGEESVLLTPREAASGLLGSVSLTCWIFLLVGSFISLFLNGDIKKGVQH